MKEEAITSIRVRESTKTELVKISGSMSAEDGKMRTLEDVILELISAHKKKR